MIFIMDLSFSDTESMPTSWRHHGDIASVPYAKRITLHLETDEWGQLSGHQAVTFPSINVLSLLNYCPVSNWITALISNKPPTPGWLLGIKHPF